MDRPESEIAAAEAKERFVHAPARSFSPNETLLFAWVGTALAGGFFPVVLLLAEFAKGLLRSPPHFDVDICFAAPVFVFGFGYAGFVCIFVALAGALFVVLTQIRGIPVWLASLVGGWTGFISTAPLGNLLSPSPTASMLLATLMGQFGAAAFVEWTIRRNRQSLVPVGPSQPLRIGLRQLFGATTFACIAAAAIGAASFSRHTMMMIAVTAALQALVIAVAKLGVYLWAKSRRSRNTSVT